LRLFSGLADSEGSLPRTHSGAQSNGRLFPALPRRIFDADSTLDRTGKISGRIFRQAVSQPDVFVDLSSFVTVFLSFFGAMFYFAEGMLGVQDGFRDNFQRFRHISLPFSV